MTKHKKFSFKDALKKYKIKTKIYVIIVNLEAMKKTKRTLIRIILTNNFLFISFFWKISKVNKLEMSTRNPKYGLSIGKTL